MDCQFSNHCCVHESFSHCGLSESTIGMSDSSSFSSGWVIPRSFIPSLIFLIFSCYNQYVQPLFKCCFGASILALAALFKFYISATFMALVVPLFVLHQIGIRVGSILHGVHIQRNYRVAVPINMHGLEPCWFEQTSYFLWRTWSCFESGQFRFTKF